MLKGRVTAGTDWKLNCVSLPWKGIAKYVVTIYVR
jgi:hypothetical protein